MNAPNEPIARDDGGNAFPADPQHFRPQTIAEFNRIAGGMTLRQYFVGQVVLVMNAPKDYADERQREREYTAWAKKAHAMADALIAAGRE